MNSSETFTRRKKSASSGSLGAISHKPTFDIFRTRSRTRERLLRFFYSFGSGRSGTGRWSNSIFFFKLFLWANEIQVNYRYLIRVWTCLGCTGVAIFILFYSLWCTMYLNNVSGRYIIVNAGFMYTDPRLIVNCYSISG